MNRIRIYQRGSVIVLLFSLIFISSCSKPSEEVAVHMAFENAKFVSSFPLNFTLDEPSQPKTDNIGLRRIRIVDSLLILDKPSSKGFWEIYKLPEYENLGAYLNMGDGPLEFKQSPSVAQKSTFTDENQNLVTYLYDFQKGRILKFNISASIANSELHLFEHDAAIPPNLFAFVFLGEDSFFIKEIANKDTQQMRYVVRDGEKQIPAVLAALNDASIKVGEDFNILSTITRYSKQHEIFVEAPIGLNNINIYKLDGSLSKSIVMGKELSDLNAIQNENRWDRKYTFSDLRLFDDFFGVVYINEGEKNYQMERKKLPFILLFDWEGNPLAKIETREQFTSFDIDLTNQELYTFDVKTDRFVKYDMEMIFSKL
jgi:hypothetical protein